MHLDVIAAPLRKHRANRAGGERWSIAIAAEVAEHDSLEFSRKQFFDYRCRCRI